jgi:glycosyltransferase involved in cell wall biosynthesis
MAGRALVESMLSATPVVAYDVDWHREVIEDGVTGFIVPVRDSDGMGTLIAEVVHGRHDAVGPAARRSALDAMDPHRLADHERDRYELILGKRRR